VGTSLDDSLATWNGGSYYYAGAVRIALREDSDQGSEVYFILTDHLGSTSVIYRASDGQTATQKHPLGRSAPATGELPVDHTLFF
jgi:hypothetical protein